MQPTIAVITIKRDTDGKPLAIVSGDNIARDRDDILHGLEHAASFVRSHGDDDVGAA